MIKKALLGTAAVAAVAAFVFGADVFSYAKTAGSSVRNAVKSEVPLEFQVQRARKMVEELVPDIRHSMHVVAEQQVDIEHLQSEIARKSESLEEQKRAVLALRGDLESGDKTFVHAGQTYSAQEVKRDLAQRFERYKTAKETLDRDRQILAARKQALEASQKKLANMLQAKQDLKVKVENLQARLKTLQAAETVSSLEIDDSQLNRAKTLIRELDKQLDVKRRMLDAEGKFTGLIPVEGQTEAPQDIAREIDAYFGGEEGEKAKTDVAVAETEASS